MSEKRIIVWFQKDLRLTDNPAFFSAAKEGQIIPVYIFSDNDEGNWPLGAASKWWLHHSLQSLKESLESYGGFLCFSKENVLDALLGIAKKTRAQKIVWNRRYDPTQVKNEIILDKKFKSAGIEVETFNASLLVEPWEIATKQNRPFQVFTQFWNAAKKWEARKPFSIPKKILFYPEKLSSLRLEELKLLPKINWAEGISNFWKPGEKEAKRKLNAFFSTKVEEYSFRRDLPAEDGVSLLSPHLHFGEISPHQILYESQNRKKQDEAFIRQIYWREFAYHLIYHFPQTTQKPLREKFADFRWSGNSKWLEAWQKGLTGYPIIDAGMRQLWAIGWMHNRIRLLVASFLTKDLLLPWQKGAKWFWDTLVDADLANNTLGWQWTAGCGADAAPFFRIFNPIVQAEKFDPEGDYVRKWVPELDKVPSKWIHRPFQAPEQILKQSGVILGKNYPWPIVDHAKQRQLALEEFHKLKGKK